MTERTTQTTADDVSPSGNVIDVLRTSAARVPDRTVLVAGSERWTYRELWARVRRCAARFGAIPPGGPLRVMIVGANHPAYVTSYFAAHAIGASTVEINRDESLERLLDVVSTTAPGVVVTDRDDLAHSLRGRVQVDRFDEVLSLGRSAGADWLPAPVRCGHAEASIVFTSGTTGTPKGIVLSHVNTLFVVNAVRALMELTEWDRRAIVLPLCHTYGKTNLLSAISAGASVVLLSGFHDYQSFFRDLARERCTVLSVVPFHLNAIARRGIPDGCNLSALRLITTSGGPLPAAAADAIRRLLPHVSIASMYGLTESGTRVSMLDPSKFVDKRGSVGRPLPGVQIEIRGEDGAPLPTGHTGEIVVRGPNVMQGYFGDPELTTTTLVGGWLRTGDLGRLDDEGYLFIEGRSKEILKVAGERISPLEIEAAIAVHSDVEDVAVVGIPDPLLGEAPCAYVVPRDRGQEIPDLTLHCAARLTAHKRPRQIRYVDHIPRTPTGKVRRHLLVKENQCSTRQH